MRNMLAMENGVSHPFWRVYNRVAKNWYELEYGVDTPSWYRNGMVTLEAVIADAAAESYSEASKEAEQRRCCDGADLR